jgi:hypothetical protein
MILAFAPEAARAQGTSAASPPAAYAPADKNKDGVVSRREQRRFDRAQRRALRRAASGGKEDANDAAADAADEAADAEETGEAAAASAGAMSRASAAAEQFRNALPSAEAGGGLPGAKAAGRAAAGRPAAGKPVAASRPAAAAAGTGDPSNPKSPADFALAARSGYAPAFTAVGLKLAADGRTVVRADGAPATAEDMARLRAAISSMPAALVRRPDFFAHVTPEHFAELKRGYHERPDLSDTVYKDVGPTAGDRDLVHTRSCEKISGECNASVEKSSYKKGDFVAPEDLDRMWSALQKELDASDAAGGDGAASPARTDAPGTPAPGDSFDGSAPRAPETAAPGAAAAPKGESRSASPREAAGAATRRLWRAATSVLGLGPKEGRPDGRDGASAEWVFGAAALAALVLGLVRLRR